MFETWLLISGILCYAIIAYMLSPSLRQLKQEHDNAKQMYLNRGSLIGKVGMAINNWHYEIVNKRIAIIIFILLIWIVVTTLWVIE
jgi:hypothetical protein